MQDCGKGDKKGWGERKIRSEGREERAKGPGGQGELFRGF